MRRVALVMTLILASAPAMGQDRTIDLIGRVTWISTDADDRFDDPPRPDVTEIEIDDSTGFGIALNVYWGSRISTEFAASIAEPNVIITQSGDAVTAMRNDQGIKIIPVSVTLQYHFRSGRRFDPYAGIGGAYILFDDLEDEHDFDDIDLDRVDFDDSVGLVLNLGMNIDFTDRIGLNLDAKYIPFDSSAKAVFNTGPDEASDISINPLIVSGGIVIHF